MDATLAAGRFSLREITPADAWLEQALSRVPDVVRFTYYSPELSVAAAQARLATYAERAAAGLVRRYVVRDGAEALGTCGAGHLDEEVATIFYALLPVGRGRGAATAAVRALCAALAADGHPRVLLETIQGNGASERVAERAGFVHDGAVTGDHRGAQVLLDQWVWCSHES